MTRLESIFGSDYCKLIDNELSLYDKALLIVKKMFDNVFDKVGKPYLNHLLYVSNRGTNDVQRIVGLLHDLFEDTSIKSSDLLEIGFPKDITDKIDIVTRKEDETYPEFIDRILMSDNVDVISVKSYDMENNMDESRLNNLSLEEKNKIN